MDDKAKNARRRITVCRIVSGACMEASGALRRVRWAVGTDITADIQQLMDATADLLLRQATAAEAEAVAVLAETPNAFDPPKPVEPQP
jgi:hypothetical protein